MRRLLLLACLICLQIPLFADISNLKLSDVHKEMDKEFALHVTQKEMSTELMKHAITQYLMQFDPLHIYLLASEVAPFYAMSESELRVSVEQYNHGNFAVFERMNNVIQAAIRRIRDYRRNLVVSEDNIRRISRETLPPIPENLATDLSTYATTEQQLEAWNSVNMDRLIMNEYASLQHLRKSATIRDAVKAIELAIEEYENKYIYLTNQGRPMGDAQKESLYTLHILQALTKSLDAHSQFMSAQQAQNLRIMLQKEYIGVGLGIEQEGTSYVITSLMSGGTAEKSGQIKIGDELLTIDDHDITDLTPEDVQAMLQGKVDSPVTLKLNRASYGKYEVTLIRKEVIIKEGRVDARYEKVPGGILAVVQLHGFYQGDNDVTAEQDMRKALENLSKQGTIKGMVLDLRDNHGGFLVQAVKIAGLFIKSGVIVVAKDSKGALHYFRDTDPNVLYNGPLVILTSKETASAAEIVAQALKDYGVAVTVGDPTTFGKGSIQMERNTGKAGSEMSNVTVGRYFSVSGYSPQRGGVKADVVVPGNLEQSRIGEEYLPDTLEKDSIAPSYIDSLSDIPASQRIWFQKYYRPYIQEQVTKYRKWIPELQKLSQARIASNTKYEELLLGKGSSNDPQANADALKDEQMKEAVNVTKDLIRLSGNS